VPILANALTLKPSALDRARGASPAIRALGQSLDQSAPSRAKDALLIPSAAGT